MSIVAGARHSRQYDDGRVMRSSSDGEAPVTSTARLRSCVHIQTRVKRIDILSTKEHDSSTAHYSHCKRNNAFAGHVGDVHITVDRFIRLQRNEQRNVGNKIKISVHGKTQMHRNPSE